MNPFRELVAEIINQAVDDLKLCDKGLSLFEARRLLHWFMGSLPKPHIAFEACCDELGLDAEDLRSRLKVPELLAALDRDQSVENLTRELKSARLEVRRLARAAKRKGAAARPVRGEARAG